MDGSIPDSLYELTQLKILSLSGHSFVGKIKSDIGNLKNLTQLLLDDNKFTGTLPSELGLCVELGKSNMSLGVKSFSFQLKNLAKSIHLSCSRNKDPSNKY